MKKAIPGFEGFYEVSDFGKVFSVRSGKELAQWKTRKKYWMVSLWVGGKRKGMSVHSAVLSAFVGPRPEGNYHACHYDGNPDNNSLENLRWDTVSANHMDKKRHGTFQEGTKHGMSKLDPEKVRAIRESGETHAELARRLGVSETTVGYVRKGVIWRHVA